MQIPNHPYDGAEAVDISSTDHTVSANDGVSRALFVGVAGDVKVDMANGATVTFASMAAGIHKIAITKVYKTGTAATGLVVLH